MSETTPSIDARDLDRDIAGCARAHQRLLAHLDELLETDQLRPEAPSLLPNWTVGHVLTHIARNADGLTTMLDGAERGEERPMYPSAEARDQDINAGASRDANVQVQDVRTAIWRLEQQWSQLTSVGWSGFGLARGNRLPIHEIPFRRWREVEVHHVDLGCGFTPANWPAEYIATDSVRVLDAARANGTEIPNEVLSAEPWQQLAWALGRESGLTSPPLAM